MCFLSPWPPTLMGQSEICRKILASSLVALLRWPVGTALLFAHARPVVPLHRILPLRRRQGQAGYPGGPEGSDRGTRLPALPEPELQFPQPPCECPRPGLLLSEKAGPLLASGSDCPWRGLPQHPLGGSPEPPRGPAPAPAWCLITGRNNTICHRTCDFCCCLFYHFV